MGEDVYVDFSVIHFEDVTYFFSHQPFHQYFSSEKVHNLRIQTKFGNMHETMSCEFLRVIDGGAD
jgi:hypothetical protein